MRHAAIPSPLASGLREFGFRRLWQEYRVRSIVVDAGIHMFRMQLFFLLAGFFACLLVRKRGVGSFLRNRFFRIAVRS